MSNQFITVPATQLPDGTTVPEFLVGAYACAKGEDGKAIITAEGTPWVNINYHEAVQACQDAGYQLITERQWLAIAHNVASVDSNWTKGKVGEGKLFRGLRFDTVSSAQPGTYESPNAKERRWLTLSNGDRICDMAGNVFQWVFDNAQGDEKGIVSAAFATDSVSLAAPYPSAEKGMGWRPSAGSNWSGYALIRGGCWGSGSYAGAFYLRSDWPVYRSDLIGFRCTQPGL